MERGIPIWAAILIGTLLATIVLLVAGLLYTTGNLEMIGLGDTATPQPSFTPSQSPTASATPSATLTHTPSHTPTNTPTATFTPTATPTNTPTPTPVPPSFVLSEIESTWLETQREVRVYQLFAENTGTIFNIGRSLRYEANVTVTAGIDLSLLTLDDIEVNGTTVTITIPQPQLRDCILDETTSRYYERNCDAAGVVDIGCGGLEAELRDQAPFAALNDDENTIFLADAYVEAAAFLQDLVQVTGIDQVIIQQSTDPLSIVSLGGTCPLPDDPN